jgi:hypothetical protein
MDADNTQPRPDAGRRGFLLRGAFTFLTGLFAGRAALAQGQKPAEGLKSTGQPLTTRMRQGEPPSQPLDTMVLFERGDNNNDRAMTHEVLSLIHEEKGKNSYPWTLYTSLATHHEQGDACVICSRLHKHGPGWSSGVHSEVFNHAPGCALGMNIEMSNDFQGPENTVVIGMNIQAVFGPRPMQYGIQIHDNREKPDNTAHFETGIGLNGHGKHGIDMGGKYDVGINARDNNIRLNEGACVELDGAGKIRVRYKNGRIEFLNGDKCVAHLDMGGEDHKM